MGAEVRAAWIGAGAAVVVALIGVFGPKLLERPSTATPSTGASNGARVVLHVHEGDSFDLPEAMRARLLEQGYVVPAIRTVDSDKGPQVVTQVRYFRTSDRVGADRIATLLTNWGAGSVERQYIGGLARVVSRNSYEIWFVQR